ncbi:MAG: GNAT family N-acetyltransferase [Planctomycetes bacterium]|nr:GNAT family N-acetyltransferase [Planctomycetota bacterium]
MTDLKAIEIVEANLDLPQHQRAVVGLLDGYARTPAGGGAPISAEARERMLPELRRRANRLILLALIDGKPAGIAVCFEGFSTFMARPLLNIHDLAVHPEHQQRGVGTQLLAEVERRARERGCCRVTLEVLEHNVVARKLYRRLGFRGDGEAEEANYFLTKKL